MLKVYKYNIKSRYNVRRILALDISITTIYYLTFTPL